MRCAFRCFRGELEVQDERKVEGWLGELRIAWKYCLFSLEC